MTRIALWGGDLQGADLAYILGEEGEDFTRYSSIRVLMCDSAREHGQGMSMAEQMARATGVPTVGFVGPVTVEGPLVNLIMAGVQAGYTNDQIEQLASHVSDRLLVDWHRNPALPYALRVLKDPRELLPDGSFVRYRPWTYHPGGRRYLGVCWQF